MSPTAKRSQADSRMLSKRASAATRMATALALAQISEARQQTKIASPAVLVRPRKTINPISSAKDSAHAE